MPQEHLPINALYSFFDSRNIMRDDVEDLIQGIDASNRYAWIGAVEAERSTSPFEIFDPEKPNTTEVIIFLLPNEDAGPYLPYQASEIARYASAEAVLKRKLAPLVSLNVHQLDPDKFDMLGAQEKLERFSASREKASTIFSVDLIAKASLLIER